MSSSRGSSPGASVTQRRAGSPGCTRRRGNAGDSAGRSPVAAAGGALSPPVISARKAEISPRYLPEDEGCRIADLRRAGLGVRAIAGQVEARPVNGQQGAAPQRRARQRAATGRSRRSGWPRPAAGPARSRQAER